MKRNHYTQQTTDIDPEVCQSGNIMFRLGENNLFTMLVEVKAEPKNMIKDLETNTY